MTIGRRALLLLPALLPLASAAAEPAEPRREQSPIDFRPADLQPADLADLRFDYASSTGVRMTYISTENSPCDEPGDEETIRAVVPPGAGTLRVGRQRYELQQVHWHAASEHLLDGHRFPLEQHLVHTDADGRLLVVAVWLRHGRPHRTLGRLFGALPPECTPDREVADVDLGALLPRSHQSMRYRGSLTTSPYSEDVAWVMLTRPMVLSRPQAQAFAGHFPSGNARGVQPLGDRTVQLDLR
ncbi:MAG: carbonic anhydrase family protein [Thermocrispum sp.]